MQCFPRINAGTAEIDSGTGHKGNPTVWTGQQVVKITQVPSAAPLPVPLQA